MPNLANHESTKITKLLLMGDSGSGKTGALASLANAGYHLHILDFDMGLDSLVHNVRRMAGENSAKVLANITYESLRDKYKGSPLGPMVDGSPTAFNTAMKLLDKWDGEVPGKWGPEHIVVIDSLTFLSEAAFNWAKFLNSSAKDMRQVYGAAQDAIENVLALLTGTQFQTNVIVVSHVKYIERQDGQTKGYPTSVGSALSPKIPSYFNSVALVEMTGTGKNLKRTIRTQATAMIDLKNPASFNMVESLPIDSGLADFFLTVKGN